MEPVDPDLDFFVSTWLCDDPDTVIMRAKLVPLSMKCNLPSSVVLKIVTAIYENIFEMNWKISKYISYSYTKIC